MTKEQYLKHKEVMDWFYNQPKGTKVWLKYADTNNWNLVLYPEWFETTEYIIDDEYTEFRKALLDGKQVQWEQTEDTWINIPSNYDFIEAEQNGAAVEEYRIKPKFKVGDWVVPIRIVGDTPFKVEDHHKHIIEKPFCDGYKLWEPQLNEYCWFFDCNTNNEPLFGRFSCMSNGKYMIKRNNLFFYFSKCEPFIGTLPSSLETKN